MSLLDQMYILLLFGSDLTVLASAVKTSSVIASMGGVHSRRRRGKIVKCQSFEEFIRKGKPGEGNPSYNIQLDNDQVSVLSASSV